MLTIGEEGKGARQREQRFLEMPLFKHLTQSGENVNKQAIGQKS